MKNPTRLNITIVCFAILGILFPFAQSAAAQTCVSPPPGLVSWYPGESNAEDQQNSSDGVRQGGTTFVAGKVGQAFNFDGVDDYVSIPDVSASRSPSFTVEGWFLLRQAPQAGSEYYFASKYAGFAGWIFRIGNSLKPGFSIHRQPSSEAHAGSSVAIPLNTWVHIAATYDGTTANLYLNGVLRGSATLIGGYTPFGGEMRIGTATWTTGGFVPGAADEVSIYDRVLSFDEIQLIVNAGTTSRCKATYFSTQGCALQRSNLTSRYPAQGTPHDVQHGNDATLVGGATYAPGKVGDAFLFNAFSFNGTSAYASLPVFRNGVRNPDFTFTTEATVEAWVKTKATTGDFQAIVSSTTFDFVHLQMNGGGNIVVYTNVGGISLPPIPQTPTGVWRHVALSIKSGNTRLYVDGNLLAMSTTTFSTLTSPSSELRIGSGFGGGRFFNGEIDEVGIYHRALSAAEIKAIVNAGSLGKCTACTALPVGATNFFPGEGNAEDVQGSSNGTPQNGVTFPTGMVGQSFNFNGQNYVNVPGTFGGGPETTVEAWYRSSGSTGDFQAIASSTVSGQFMHLQLHDSGKIVVHTNTGNISFGNVKPEFGVWHHIAVSVKSGNSRLYLDGRLIEVNGLTFSSINPTSNLRIGSGVITSGTAGRFFKGDVDEVKIYNRALSQSEILTIYNGRGEGSCRPTAVSSNSDFANATILKESGLIYGTNVGATRESGEPMIEQDPGGSSVWYRWRAPATGTYIFTTFGSNFDTVLGVYTGSAVNALMPIASNDDNGYADNIDGPTLTSSLTFDAIANITYYIAVDGASGRTGNIALGWGLRVSLSGEVRNDSVLQPMQKVTVSLRLVGDDSRSTSLTFSAQTSSTGRFSFPNLRVGGNYVLTVEGHTGAERGHLNAFIPLSGDLSGANFAVSAGTVTIFPKPNFSGRVTNNGAGFAGVTISITGTASLTLPTNNDGIYTVSSVPRGDYTVTPSSPGYIFDPPFEKFFDVDFDVLGVDFDALQGDLTISGQTSAANGTPIGGVTLTLAGAQAATQQSDANGNYEFKVFSGKDYTVTATKAGVTFSQPTLPFTSISTNQKNADFTSIAPIQITLNTNPSGLMISVDQDPPVASPLIKSWVPGSTHTISTTSPQSGGTGTQHIWANWSDGGLISHTVTAPAVATTYTANFTTQHQLTMVAGAGGTVLPASGSFFNQGQSVQISATPNSGFSFGSWSGAGNGSFSGSTNPVNVTMNGPITETASFTQNPVQMSIQTVPVGRTVSIDGGPAVTAPINVQWMPGSQHTIATTSPQAGTTGTQYVWSNWSDGGSISHSVTAPAVATTYTATFTTQHQLTMVAGAGGSVLPASGSFFNQGQIVQITAAPNAGFIFGSWTGSGNGSFTGSTNPVNVTINGPITQTASFAPANTIQLSASSFSAAENAGQITVTVTRNNSAGSATVDYASSDLAGPNNCNVIAGAASSRCDYLITLGTLNFAAGESSKTISIPITDDVYAEGAETFTFTLSNPVGATLGSPAVATLTITDNDATNGTNPIDTASFFVRQHYLDFLNREPDTGGLNFWSNQITSCGADTQCVEVKRINVSAAFFLSIEFQETGYLVYRLYKTSFGNLSGAPVPVRFIDFLRDTQQIGRGVQVGVPGSEPLLEANKVAFVLAYVQRPDFQVAFPDTMTAEQFVTALDTKAGAVLSAAEKANLIAVLGANPADLAKRASVLRSVAEDSDLKNLEFNKAFVLMQYFGYMRRNPNDLPDTDFGGYDFWLGKLNSFGGNFVDAEMVKAFITSGEYQHRFGP